MPQILLLIASLLLLPLQISSAANINGMERLGLISAYDLSSPSATTCVPGLPENTPDSRYMQGSDYVVDNETNLVWQKCTVGQTTETCEGSSDFFNWQGALQYAATLRQTTGVNWRVPNINELESLNSENCSLPSMNTNVFPNALSGDYWSASPNADNQTAAWYTNFGYGFSFPSAKSNTGNLRLVREAQFITVEAIIANKTYDGTVVASMVSHTVAGIIPGDDVGLVGTPVATFSDDNVGTNKLVTITGWSISGDDAGNYILNTPIISYADVVKADQTINFAPLDNKVYGDDDFDITATAEPSGLVVLFTSLSSEVCSVTNTNTGAEVSLLEEGGCTIQASQSGNANYNPAANQNQSFTVGTSALQITVDAANRVYDSTTKASVSNIELNGVKAGDDVSLFGVASAVFDTAEAGEDKTVTITGLSLSGADASKYVMPNPVTTEATIFKANQNIIFNSLSDKIYSLETFIIDVRATSGLAVNVSSLSPIVCTINNSTMEVALVGVGTCRLRAEQQGDDNYHKASEVTQTFGVSSKPVSISAVATNKIYDGNKSVPSITNIRLYGVINGDDTTIMGDALGLFSDPEVGNNKEVTITGLSITGSDVNNYYLETPVVSTANITESDQVITFDEPPLTDKTYGDAAFLVNATASSGLTVSYLSTTTTVCTVNNKTVSLINIGTCSITASQSGNDNYTAAADVSQSFTISKKMLTITATAQDKIYDGTTSVYPVTNITLNGVVNGDNVFPLGVGTAAFNDAEAGIDKIVTIIDLSIAGDDVGKYYLSEPVTTTATISKADQNIIFIELINKIYGVAPFELTATADPSGLAVSFSSADSAVCTVSGTTVSVVGTGECTIDANQAGNNNYNSASEVTQKFTVVQKELTITAIAEDRAYDGTIDVSITTTELVGVVNNDDAYLDGTAIGEFLNANVGENKFVTVRGLSLGGRDAQHYNLITPATTHASIIIADQMISFDTVEAKVYGDANFDVTASSDSGLAVSFISISTNICNIAGSTVSILDIGVCTLRASQLGNSNYNPAPESDQSFTVTSKMLTVTATADDKPYDGNASATISNSILNGVVGDDDVNMTGDAIGTFSDDEVGDNKQVTITGLSLTGGDINRYYLQDPIFTTASITKAEQMITFDALEDKYEDDYDFALTAISDSGLTVTFVSMTGTICSISDNVVVSLDIVGTCTIKASQVGDDTYQAASDVEQSFAVLVSLGNDTDEDGMPDIWEEEYGLDPNDPSDAKTDADNDGYYNLWEYQADTYPNDPNSFPLWTKISDTGKELTDDEPLWSCVKNNITGDIWEVKTAENNSDAYTFEEASGLVDVTNSNALCGYNNWRVPSRDELLSVVDDDARDPAIDTRYFINALSDLYWSSTSISGSVALSVDFYNGGTFDESKTSTLYVRLMAEKNTNFLPAIYFLLQ